NSPKADSARRETAQYVADMVLELRGMAKAYDLQTLQSLLEASFYEAFSVANHVEIPPGEIEKLRELSLASTG
ncbi:MAG: hypothetical protein KGO94_10375, partial [Alphaproteobacteria bacterium]|nr:hypothetical protein [Alphaproteobacteria bacterium]